MLKFGVIMALICTWDHVQTNKTFWILGVDKRPLMSYISSMKQTKGAIMKTIINTIAGLLICLGIMAMAGSANDCDGHCMEAANTFGEMLVVAGIGLAMTLFGGMILLVNGEENA